MNRSSRVYIAGHTGLLGSALLRRLETDGYTNVIAWTHAELDLTDGVAVRAAFQAERPEYVVLAAARVGGIWANDSYRAEFIHANLAIQTTVIDAAYRAGVSRLLFFGSNCAYPKDGPQPMDEEHLLTGSLEPTSEAYAVAKIAGMAMCDAYNRQYGSSFVSLIPPTLFGPGDHFQLGSSHVVSALIDRFDRARERGQPSVEVWGTGTQRREFMYVDDLADACIIVLGMDDDTLRSVAKETRWVLNAGPGQDMTILELATQVAGVVGYGGEITTDPARPDGATRKLLDSRRIRRLGWSPRVTIRDGLERTYRWYRANAVEVSDGLR